MMSKIGCLVVLVGSVAPILGCSSAAPTATDGPLACAQTVAQRCAMGDPPPGQDGVYCRSTLAAATEDPALCQQSNEATCGAYTVLTWTNVDLSYRYYYDSTGTLVAITQQVAPSTNQQCLAGNGTFVVPPSGCGSGTKAACGPLDAANSD
jgi:hypothetical protein